MKSFDILFLLFFTFCNHNVFTQNIKGRVSDIRGNGIEGVLIYLLGSDSSSLILMTISNTEGNWELNYNLDESHILKMEHLSYKEKYFVWEDVKNNLSGFNVFLEESDIELPPVIIQEKRIGIVNSGDTIHFNVDFFDMKDGRQLKDIFKRLPGFHVDGDGQIYYNGRKFDKLLLDGKDILQDQHRMAGESFMIRDVIEIQVIEQYKPFRELFSTSYSDQIALNIVLRENAREKLKGEIELLAGYEDKYAVKSNAFKIGKTFSHNSFFRSNNNGEATFTPIDYMNLFPSIARTLTQAGGDIQSILPQEFLKPNDATQNIENVISTGLLLSKSDKIETKLSMTGFYADRDRYHIFSRSFFSSAINISGEAVGTLHIPFLSINANTKIALNDKTNLEIELPIEYRNQKELLFSNGVFDSISYNSSFRNHNYTFMYLPQIYFSRAFKNHWMLSISQINHFEKETAQLSVVDPSYVFNVGTESVTQNLIVNENKNISTVSIEKQLKNHQFGFLYTAYFQRQNINIVYNTILSGFNHGKHKIIDEIHEPALKYHYKTTTWWHTLKGSVKNISREDNFGFHGNKNFLTFSYISKYSFSRFHYILLKMAIDKNLINPTNTWKVDEIIDARTVSTGNMPSDHNILSTTTSLNYLLLNITQKRRLHVQLNYSKINDPVLMGSASQDLFVLILPYSAEKSLTSLVAISGELPISKKWVLKPSFRFSNNKNFLLDKGYINLGNIQWGSSILSNWKNPLNIELNYFKTDNLIKNPSFSNVYTIHEVVCKTIFSKEKIRLVNDIRYNIQKSNLAVSTVQFFKINFQWEYLYKNGWTFYFTGIDVTNLKPNSVIQTLFSENQFSFLIYNRFPGSILVGIKKAL